MSPHRHRAEGLYRGVAQPALFEAVPAVGRYLGAAIIVGEGSIVDATG